MLYFLFLFWSVQSCVKNTHSRTTFIPSVRVLWCSTTWRSIGLLPRGSHDSLPRSRDRSKDIESTKQSGWNGSVHDVKVTSCCKYLNESSNMTAFVSGRSFKVRFYSFISVCVWPKCKQWRLCLPFNLAFMRWFKNISWSWTCSVDSRRDSLFSDTMRLSSALLCLFLLTAEVTRSTGNEPHFYMNSCIPNFA